MDMETCTVELMEADISMVALGEVLVEVVLVEALELVLVEALEVVLMGVLEQA